MLDYNHVTDVRPNRTGYKAGIRRKTFCSQPRLRIRGIHLRGSDYYIRSTPPSQRSDIQKRQARENYNGDIDFMIHETMAEVCKGIWITGRKLQERLV